MSIPRLTHRSHDGQSRTVIQALLAVVVGLVIAAVAAGQNGGDDSALRGYYSANGMLNRGMNELAVAEYRQFLGEHPDHDKTPVARYGLAVALYRLARHDEVLLTLAELRMTPGFEFAPEALMVMGQSRLALGQPEQAAAAFGRLIREHGDTELADEAAALEAESLYEAGRLDEVARPCALLRERWPQSPQRPRAELFAGLAEMGRGEYAAATKRFESMSAQFQGGPYEDRVTLLLAQCRHRTGGLHQAAADYRAVLDGAAEALIPEALYGLAVLEHRLGRHQSAARLLERFLDEYGDHELAGAARLTRGRVWFDLEDYDLALEAFEQLASSGDAAVDEATYWVAKTQLRRGDPEAAARGLRKAIERFPDSDLAATMTYDLAVALSRSGDLEAALETLARFRREYDDHELTPDALHLTAATLHGLERYQDSAEVCGVFQRRFADHDLAPAIAFLAAENTFLLGEHERAAAAYRALLDDDPQHPRAEQARFRLGLSLYYLGRFDEAEPLLVGVADGRDTRPEFATALLAVGDARFQAEQWEGAEESLRAYLSFGLDQPSADDALLKLGLARKHQGDLQGALRAFEHLIAEFDESPLRLHATFEQARVLEALGRGEEATTAYAHVAAAGGDSPFTGHALHHLGAAAQQRGDSAEAASLFGRAADSFASTGQADAEAEALFQQGQALMSAQQYDDAAAVFDRLAGEHASHDRVGHASALAAIALTRQGDPPRWEEALSAIRQVESAYAETLDPSLRAALLYEKAWCLRELGRSDEAAGAYEAMIREEPPGPLFGHALLELAELNVEDERYDQAAELLRRLLSLEDAGDLHGKAAYTLGLCVYHQDDLAEAADLLEGYLDDDPDAALITSARVLCAEALYRTGRPRAAAGHLARVVESPANDAYGPSLLRLGECRAAIQEWPASERAFERYLSDFPDSDVWFQAQFGVGWALENQGRYDEAMGAYRRVVEDHQGPTAARAQFQIGECLFAAQRLDEAVRELLKVDILYAYPEWSAGALYEAGRCFRQMGSPVEARKQFEQVVGQYPESKWAGLAKTRLEELAQTSLPGHQKRGDG